MPLQQAVKYALAEPIQSLEESSEQSPHLRKGGKEKYGGLTTRERQVALLVARGKSNREIAEDLVLSERTVENHVSHIFSRLGFHSRIQIATWVVENGLLDNT